MGRETKKRTENFQAIKDLEQANEGMREIADLNRQIEAENLVMNEKIDGIKEETEAVVTPLAERIEALVNGLQMFCEINEDVHFKDARSINLNNGTMGFRKSTKLDTFKPKGEKKKPTWASVVATLEEKGEGYHQAVKVTKSANKEVLGEWTDEKLAEVCVKRKTTDNWWYETVKTEVKGASEGGDK